MEYVFDQCIQLDSSEIHRRAWAGFLRAENRGTRNFAGPCQFQRGLETKVPAFLDCERLVAHGERRERRLEKFSIDRILLIEDDFGKWRDLKVLELANSKRLHLDKVPLMRELQNRCPNINTCIVQGVLSAEVD